MDPAAIAIGIAGLAATVVASGLGLYFTYKARTAPYRSTLYAKQLGLAESILTAAEDLQYEAKGAVDATDDEELDRVLGQFVHKVNAMAALNASALASLPMEMIDELVEFNSELGTYYKD